MQNSERDNEAGSKTNSRKKYKC